jgi:hypothetical protein
MDEMPQHLFIEEFCSGDKLSVSQVIKVPQTI